MYLYKGEGSMEIIWFIIGLLIAWNFPQPQFAKDIQAKVVGFFKKD